LVERDDLARSLSKCQSGLMHFIIATVMIRTQNKHTGLSTKRVEVWTQDSRGGEQHLSGPTKWAVAHELIEWQPAYVGFGAEGHRGGHWSADWASTDSSKVTWLIDRLRTAGAAPPPPPDRWSGDGKLGDWGEDGSDFMMRNGDVIGDGGGGDGGGGGFDRYDNNDHPAGDNINDDFEGIDGGGGGGGGGGSGGFHSSQRSDAPIRTHAPDRPPPGWSAGRKAVVYSAFWEHIQLIQMHFVRHGIPFAVCLRQGLTLVHFSPQPELFLTQNTP